MKHVLWILFLSPLFFCSRPPHEADVSALEQEIKELVQTQAPAAPVFEEASKTLKTLTRQGMVDRAESLAICMIEHYSYALGREELPMEDLEPVLGLYDGMTPKHKACVDKYMGRIHKRHSRYEQAMTCFKRSLQQYSALTDPAEIDVYIDLAQLCSQQKKTEDARDYYQKAIDRAKQVNPHKLGRALFVWAMFLSRHSPGEAIANYRESLPYLKEQIPFLYPHALRNLSGLQIAEGDADEALATLSLATEAYEVLNQPTNLVMALIDMGEIYALFGERQKAFDQYKKAGQVLGDNEKLGYYKALVHFSTGQLYDNLGEYEQAWPELEMALNFFEANPTSLPMIIAARLSVGNHFLLLNNSQKALKYFHRALNAMNSEKPDLQLGRIYYGIGEALSMEGNLAEALCFMQEALHVQQTLNLASQESKTLSGLTEIYFQQGRLKKAESHAIAALSLHRDTGNRSEEAFALHLLAGIQQAQGEWENALLTSEAAIDILETLRIDLAARHHRASYFASIHDIYLTRISLLMKLAEMGDHQKYAALALEASEKARARTLLDFLEEIPQDRNHGETLSLAAIRKKLAGKMNSRMKLLESGETRSAVAAMDRDIEDLVAQYRLSEAEFQRSSPSGKMMDPISLRQIQQEVLDGDTVLLEYALGKERSYLWLVSPSSLETMILPSEELINEKARQTYGLLNARNENPAFETPREKEKRIEAADRDYFRVSHELSQMILGPVQSKIEGKRLLIVSEGALLLVPFSALPSPNQPEKLILDNHEVVTAPSTSVLRFLKASKHGTQKKTLAIFADPVFNEKDAPPAEPVEESMIAWHPRGQGILKLSRLPYTRVEAKGITDMLDSDQYLQALGYQANLENFRKVDLRNFRMIHLATHGYMDPRWPELSGLAFSLVDQKGNSLEWMLTLSEIFSLQINADMVVLSACQTALGAEVRGEGVIGLSHGFMNAGARSVVASLWGIQDEATALLMASFYQNMLVEEMKPAEALTWAQRSMREDPNRSFPYFWAAFTFQGPWN